MKLVYLLSRIYIDTLIHGKMIRVYFYVLVKLINQSYLKMSPKENYKPDILC